MVQAFGHLARTTCLVASITFLLVGCGAKQPTDTSDVPRAKATELAQASNEVRMQVDGFAPKTLTIKKGTTVVWRNADSVSHWVAVDPYPIHTGLVGFNSQKEIAPGGSFEFTFNRVGEWPYADHLRPVSYTGIVKVTE